MSIGRPRSEPARQAVLHAVDDLLVDVGYAAMTMKGIAERAGVGRQTVYRWWSTKAEILVEACVEDADQALRAGDLPTYLRRLAAFLTDDPAGRAYRALVGEAQHDPEVYELVAKADVLARSAADVIAPLRAPDELAVAQLIGPVLGAMLTGHPLTGEQLDAHAATLRRAWGPG